MRTSISSRQSREPWPNNLFSRWVVGALDSVWVAVYIYICRNHPHLLDTFMKIWGHNEDWVTPGSKVTEGYSQPDLLLKHLALRGPHLFEE
jgi:hypothetical protein